MRRTHVGRGKSDPFRIPPAVGQFSHDAGGRALEELAFGFVHNGGGGRSDASDVLQKEDARTAIVRNAEDFVEEAAAIAIQPGALSGDANVLARESASDEIHAATPASAVEGGDIGPDRRAIQGAFFHARRQNAGGISFPLDVADDARRDAQMLEPGSQSLVEHAGAGEEGETIEGSSSHIQRATHGLIQKFHRPRIHESR